MADNLSIDRIRNFEFSSNGANTEVCHEDFDSFYHNLPFFTRSYPTKPNLVPQIIIIIIIIIVNHISLHLIIFQTTTPASSIGKIRTYKNGLFHFKFFKSLKPVLGISTTKLLSRLISDETIPQTNSNGKTKTLCLKSDM